MLYQQFFSGIKSPILSVILFKMSTPIFNLDICMQNLRTAPILCVGETSSAGRLAFQCNISNAAAGSRSNLFPYFKVQRPSVVCVWQRLMHAPARAVAPPAPSTIYTYVYGRTEAASSGSSTEPKVWARGDKKGTNKAPIHQATRLFNQPVAAQIKLIATRARTACSWRLCRICFDMCWNGAGRELVSAQHPFPARATSPSNLQIIISSCSIIWGSVTFFFSISDIKLKVFSLKLLVERF
jgi:hypothetical protein